MDGPTDDPDLEARSREEESAVRPLVFPPLLFLVALLTGVAIDVAVPVSIFERTWHAHAIGWPIFLLGGLLARSGEGTMRQAEVDPRFRPVGTMVATGLFAHSRNPLYVSVSIAYVGLGVVWNSWWPLLLYPVLFAVLHFGVVRREERYLEGRFGAAYRDYCRRVRRWL